MLFHIGCTGRSGSVHVHRMLTRMGVRSLHEKASERPFEGKPLKFVERNPKVFQRYEGTVGWAWDINCPKLVDRAIYKFHMVRDPLTFLRSAVTHDDSLFDTVEKAIGTARVRSNPDPDLVKLTRAVNYWLGYLETFGKDRTILRVEEMTQGEESLATFCRTVGFPIEITRLAETPAKPVNSRRNKPGYNDMAVSLLNEKFPKLFDELMTAREQVGYGSPIPASAWDDTDGADVGIEADAEYAEAD